MEKFLYILMFISLNIGATSISTRNNYVVCDGCSQNEYKEKAIEKAISIGFDSENTFNSPYEEYKEPQAVEVYLYDFTYREIKKFKVIQQRALFSTSQHIAKEMAVTPSNKEEWINFTLTTESFFANPFESTYSGYSFLLSESTRAAVNSEISNNWYGLIIGASAFGQSIDSFVGLIPDAHFLERITIKFSDNVELTLSLKDPSKLSVKDIFKAELIYVVDSAFYVDEEGNKIKIPDDAVEALNPGEKSFPSNGSADAYAEYMNNYGFSQGTDDFMSYDGGSVKVSCTSTTIPKTDDEPERIVLTCKRS